MRIEDGHIIYKCLNGEPEAFGFIVDKYKESVYAFAYTKLHNFHDAEDITQEVFIKAFRKLKTLKSWDRLPAWLYAITANLCKDWIKNKSKRPDQDFVEDKDPKILESNSIDSYREGLIIDLLHDAIDSLPEIYRQVLVLHYLGDMNSFEIAEFIGMSPGSIRERLSRARTLLKKEMLEMMTATFEGQRLKAGFTFRIVETVKNIRINPVSTTNGLPWGLSLVTGILITILSLNPYTSIPIQLNTFSGSPLFSESRVLKVGEIPVDVVKTSETTFLSSNKGNKDGGERKNPDKQESFMMALKAEGGKWQMKSDNPTPYWGSSACELNGKIYVIGGLTPPFFGVNTVQEYDPILDKWTRKKDMPTSRGWLSTVAVDGLIYAIGGFQNNQVDYPTVEVYDPIKDEWIRKKDMPTPRRLFAIAKVNGKIYCIGGCQLVPNFSIVEEYDPKTDTWARKADMLTAKYGIAAGVVNNKIYVMGGSDNFAAFKTVEEYDPLLDKWTKKADMPTQRWIFGLSVINNEIYAIGGSTMNEANINSSSVVEKYNPIEDKWYRVEDLLTQRNGVSSAVVDNKIYVMAGSAHFPEPFPAVEEYTPDTSSFSIFSKGKLPSTWGEMKRD
jgi:RNA polymerase sigma factor (sigma-70 family)